MSYSCISWIPRFLCPPIFVPAKIQVFDLKEKIETLEFQKMELRSKIEDNYDRHELDKAKDLVKQQKETIEDLKDRLSEYCTKWERAKFWRNMFAALLAAAVIALAISLFVDVVV